MHLEPGTSAGDRRTRERRQGRRYTFRDQRSGFDRRTPQRPEAGTRVLERTLTDLREQPRALWFLLATVNVLNVADFALTLNALSHGFAEGNPLMGFMLELSPAWAGIFKMLCILLASLLVWRLKRYRKALVMAIAMLVIFAGIFVWHLYGLAVML